MIDSSINERVLYGIEHPIKPKIFKDINPPCQENIILNNDIDITKFPIPIYSPKDGGAYLTSGIVVSSNP